MQTFRTETVLSQGGVLTVRGVPFRAGEKSVDYARHILRTSLPVFSNSPCSLHSLSTGVSSLPRPAGLRGSSPLRVNLAQGRCSA